MKIKLTTILILFTLISAAFGGAFLEYIHASAEGESIKIEWKSGNEENLQYYAILRSPANIESYTEIAQIDPKGSNSFYSYTDNSAYRTTNMIFKYKLKIVDDSRTSYSKEVSAFSKVSGVKKTWGSIKAMFR